MDRTGGIFERIAIIFPPAAPSFRVVAKNLLGDLRQVFDRVGARFAAEQVQHFDQGPQGLAIGNFRQRRHHGAAEAELIAKTLGLRESHERHDVAHRVVMRPARRPT